MSFESEADYLGLQYMYKTGYDPQAFVASSKRLQAREKKKPGTLAKAFSTHPQTPDRIEKSQEEIGRILAGAPQYIVTTSEFDDVKARLAVWKIVARWWMKRMETSRACAGLQPPTNPPTRMAIRAATMIDLLFTAVMTDSTSFYHRKLNQPSGCRFRF